MTALLTGSVRRQSLFLQFSKICKARLLSSDKKSRPPRSKPQSFEERRKLQKAASKPAGSIPTSELLKDFLQPPRVKSAPPQTAKSSKPTANPESGATATPEAEPSVRPVLEDVIKSK
uniref:Uncharacterized protein n=2 Tax=Schistocephalus solidus TaxID=70667 RepID=A0A0X3PKX3_SCHSO